MLGYLYVYMAIAQCAPKMPTSYISAKIVYRQIIFIINKANHAILGAMQLGRAKATKVAKAKRTKAVQKAKDGGELRLQKITTCQKGALCPRQAVR